MKKIIIFIGILLIFQCKNVNGLSFKYEKENEYFFKVVWGDNKKYSKRATMYKISNESKNYYNITPIQTLFNSHPYSQAELKLDFETYKEIAKIMHYGYGYKNHTTNKHYFATQLLIFEQLEGVEVYIINSNYEYTQYFQKEIEEINNTIKKSKLKQKEYEIDTDTLYINDEYIIENFDLEIEDGIITKDEEGYNIKLLREKETYYLNLKPKNNCFPIDYWESNVGHGILGENGLCETETTILIDRKYTETLPNDEPNDTQENINPEEENIINNPADDNYYVEEEIEVNMPNTMQYSLTWLIILIFIGNLYYVCKK